MGVYDGDATVGDDECGLSILHPVRHMVNKYIYHNNADRGVAAKRKRTWIGIGWNKKDMDTSFDILCNSDNNGSRNGKKFYIYLFSVLIL